MINNSQINTTDQYRSQKADGAQHTESIIKIGVVISATIVIFAVGATAAMYFKLPSKEFLIKREEVLIDKMKADGNNKIIQKTNAAYKQVDQQDIKFRAKCKQELDQYKLESAYAKMEVKTMDNNIININDALGEHDNEIANDQQIAKQAYEEKINQLQVEFDENLKTLEDALVKTKAIAKANAGK